MNNLWISLLEIKSLEGKVVKLMKGFIAVFLMLQKMNLGFQKKYNHLKELENQVKYIIQDHIYHQI